MLEKLFFPPMNLKGIPSLVSYMSPPQLEVRYCQIRFSSPVVKNCDLGDI